MTCLLRLLMLCMLIAPAGACATKTTVVLVPDPEGKIGAVSIASKKGDVVLLSPFEETVVSSPNKPPTAPKGVSGKDVDQQFADSLSVQPEPPLHFLLFFTKETALTEEAFKELPSIAQAIRRRNCRFVSVIGHTDTLASKTYNFFLGFDRAVKVRDLLIKNGVDPAWIWVYDQGKSNLLVPTADQVYEPKNRRVEVVVR